MHEHDTSESNNAKIWICGVLEGMGGLGGPLYLPRIGSPYISSTPFHKEGVYGSFGSL